MSMHFVNKYLFRLLLLLLLLIIIIISQSVIQLVYQQDNIIHKFVRKIMVLLFLPAQIILLMFVTIPSAAKWENM